MHTVIRVLRVKRNTLRIQFSTLLLISAPSLIGAPSYLFLLISAPILISSPTEYALLIQKHPNTKKHPYSNKCPYSFSVIAQLEYMYTEINHGPSSFNCSLKAWQWKSHLRLSLLTIISPWVHSSFKPKISS